MRPGDLEAPKTIQTADDAIFAKHPCFTIYELAIMTKMIEKNESKFSSSVKLATCIRLLLLHYCFNIHFCSKKFAEEERLGKKDEIYRSFLIKSRKALIIKQNKNKRSLKTKSRKPLVIVHSKLYCF